MTKILKNTLLNIPINKMKFYSLYIIVLFLFLQIPCISQDLKNVLKQKPFTYSGGLQMGSYFSATQGRSQVTSPFGYYINANANISVYGFKIPLSIGFRDQQLNYTKPMFRLGM